MLSLMMVLSEEQSKTAEKSKKNTDFSCASSEDEDRGLADGELECVTKLFPQLHQMVDVLLVVERETIKTSAVTGAGAKEDDLEINARRRMGRGRAGDGCINGCCVYGWLEVMGMIARRCFIGNVE